MKRILAISVMFTLVFALAACGGGSKENGTTKDQGKATGTLFEGVFMTFRHSNDWTVFEDAPKKMINMEKKGTQGTLYILVKAEKESFRTAQEAVVAFAENYQGTPTEAVLYSNYEYHKTSFNFGGPQTMLVTMIEDNKVTITLQGDGHDKDKSITDILNSIELKF